MKPPPYRIDRARVADVPAILPLFEAYRSFFAGELDDASRGFLEARLGREESVAFVAWNQADAVGFIQLYPLWSSWYCRRIWFLSDLYVTQSARGGGVGASLVERVVAFAHETNAASIMVELPHSEPHLAAFYGKLGFEPDPVFSLARRRLL
jgi:GNAT superfamily N-acetyltransferase